MPEELGWNHYRFIEHTGGAKAPRFYINGRRVARAAYYAAKDRCKRLDTFWTFARQENTTFRRTNGCYGVEAP